MTCNADGHGAPMSYDCTVFCPRLHSYIAASASRFQATTTFLFFIHVLSLWPFHAACTEYRMADAFHYTLTPINNAMQTVTKAPSSSSVVQLYAIPEPAWQQSLASLLASSPAIALPPSVCVLLPGDASQTMPWPGPAGLCHLSPAQHQGFFFAASR